MSSPVTFEFLLLYILFTMAWCSIAKSWKWYLFTISLWVLLSSEIRMLSISTILRIKSLWSWTLLLSSSVISLSSTVLHLSCYPEQLLHCLLWQNSAETHCGLRHMASIIFPDSQGSWGSLKNCLLSYSSSCLS